MPGNKICLQIPPSGPSGVMRSPGENRCMERTEKSFLEEVIWKSGPNRGRFWKGQEDTPQGRGGRTEGHQWRVIIRGGCHNHPNKHPLPGTQRFYGGWLILNHHPFSVPLQMPSGRGTQLTCALCTGWKPAAVPLALVCVVTSCGTDK